MVTCTDDDSTQKFFSGCPALETICFDECDWTNLSRVCLRTPKLWKLEITECLRNCHGELYDCEVMIFAPSLHYFDYNGDFLNDYCVYDSPPLNEAKIHSRRTKRFEHPRIVFDRLYKLLNGISNVKQLILSNDTVQGLNHAADLLPYMPCFRNLSTLSFTFSNHVSEVDCEALMKIFPCFSSHENLCYKMVNLHIFSIAFDFVPRTY
ncbi:uncharacterized protein LOC119987797 [Tripterygium wilfordii]|uniref:uncharacterized protein LOC119987797 n=1 Tax=Tripterygium wilfordii TaxID=458696 RepID=UPI0018F82ED5|nr:uncharacterized protein LOC119987797 [Tripterygium wilfordii]